MDPNFQKCTFLAFFSTEPPHVVRFSSCPLVIAVSVVIFDRGKSRVKLSLAYQWKPLPLPSKQIYIITIIHLSSTFNYHRLSIGTKDPSPTITPVTTDTTDLDSDHDSLYCLCGISTLAKRCGHHKVVIRWTTEPS
jgi:hypothetical protein